jgi:predicted nucleic acid-binding Zn ribbon protein
MSHLSATMKLAEYKQLFPARHCAHCQQFFVAARSDAKTCSNTCRVALSRRKRNPTPCYQKLKRDEEARARPRPQDTVIDYQIEAIGPEEAAAFIKRYEFLQTVGRSRARYGARNSSGELVGVAIFGTPSKLADGIIVLERGACAPWAHPHAASWFIPRAVKQAAADHGWKIFFAYCDPSAGEIGTVFQACNWIYTGQTPSRTINGAPRARDYFRGPDGRVISDKAFYKRGHSMDDVKSGAWQRVRKPAKHRYVWIEAPTRQERRALAARFTALPYPKRLQCVTRRDA